MGAVLAATVARAVLTWHDERDLATLAAGLLGTHGMFLLAGIPMRVCLTDADSCRVVSHLCAGSIGGVITESLILFTNAGITVRLAHRPGVPA